MNSLSPLTGPLLDWFEKNARYMPWREDPTPYHVWISEIMLQQTRVSAVIPYYQRFLAELPDIRSLALCEEEKLLKLWEGLGYYSRARNLKKAAVKIMEEYEGVFPSSYRSIRELPGIGDYTAGAISSIAFGLPEPAVDGNVLRVLSRVTGDDSDIMAEATRSAYREAVRQVMPRDRTSAYTQALMELGATVCLPNGAPLCDDCPLSCFCVAKSESLTEVLPVKTKAKARRIENRTVYFVFNGGRVALRRRPKKGLLSGLWEYPNEISGAEPPLPQISETEISSFGSGKHVFSHIEWHMNSKVLLTDSDELPEGFVWATAEELDTVYAVPAAFRDFEKSVREQLEKN